MTDKTEYPELQYNEILKTRDTIHGYAKLLGAVRGSMTPPQKDHRHISLRAGPAGFRTTPIPTGDGHNFEILLDLVAHFVAIGTSQGYTWTMPIEGQTLTKFTEDVLSELGKLGIDPKIDRAKFKDATERVYNAQQASDIFRFYSIFDMVLKEFKGTLTQETSPVQLWPHHLDIAFTCYTESGSLITCGFLTGDTTIEEPYFYILTYPKLVDISGIALGGKAYWHTEDWQGVILKYGDLIKADSPKQELLNHLRTTFEQVLEKI